MDRTVDDLSGFFDEIARLEDDVRRKKYSLPPVFRGQANANWGLESTLDRMYGAKWSVGKYCADAFREMHAFQAFTGSRFTYVNKKPANVGELIATPEHAEFLVYLRHIGFPSPLLDWTKSKYIALYFAFCNVSDEQTMSDGRVAVYAYNQMAEPAYWESDARIQMFDTFIGTQHRHHRQQACYTVAYRGDDPNNATFERYEACTTGEKQVFKITLPMKLRDEVLFELNTMNVNGFSLFNSEEGLAASLGRDAYGKSAFD